MQFLKKRHIFALWLWCLEDLRARHWYQFVLIRPYETCGRRRKVKWAYKKREKGQESHMEIYPPEKGISPFVKASSLHPEDLKLGSLS